VAILGVLALGRLDERRVHNGAAPCYVAEFVEFVEEDVEEFLAGLFI
jgi:hypothetical protein